MSLIKHEIPQPVRHFNLHDDPLTNIETLHLVIWDKGLCIAGYDAKNSVLATKVYSFSSWNISEIESIFVNEPMVAGPQPVTHIWIAEERNLVIPQHLFEQHAAADWLRKFHFIEAGEQILATIIPDTIKATVVYPIQEKLQSLLHKYFAEGKINALSGMILCQQVPIETNHVDITFLGTKAVLAIKGKNQLLSHQIKEATDVNNLVYSIAAICQEYELNQEELDVSLSGLCIPDETIVILQSFFSKIQAPESEQNLSFSLLSKLISCVL